MKNNNKVGRKAKPVKQMTLDGKMVTVYQSLSQAAAETGISCGNISQVCSGKRKQTGGFLWCYIE